MSTYQETINIRFVKKGRQKKKKKKEEDNLIQIEYISFQRNLLSVVVKDAASVKKSSGYKQYQKNSKSKNSKSQKPSRMDSSQTRLPSFILIQKSCLFRLLCFCSISIRIAETFILPYNKKRENHSNKYPNCT